MNIELKLKCGSDGPFGAPTSCVEVEIASPTAKRLSAPERTRRISVELHLELVLNGFVLVSFLYAFFYGGTRRPVSTKMTNH